LTNVIFDIIITKTRMRNKGDGMKKIILLVMGIVGVGLIIAGIVLLLSA